MNIVVIKYMQIFCITIFFSSSANCDQLQLQNKKEEKQLYVIATCVSNCLKDDDQNITLEVCYKNCTNFISPSTNKTSELKNVQRNITMTIICRDDTSFVLNVTKIENKIFALNETLRNWDIRSDDEIPFRQSDIDDDENFIYLIKVQGEDDPFGERTIYMTNSSIIKVEHLIPNKIYNVSLTILNDDYEYSYGSEGALQFSTLQENYDPAEIMNISVSNYISNAIDPKFIDVHIVWNPAEDMTCQNEILWYSTQEYYDDFEPIEIVNPEDLYKFSIEKLKFDMEYCIKIKSKNTKDPSRESPLNSITIKTPNCLEFNLNDGNLCQPPRAKNVQATETRIAKNTYIVNVSWELPDVLINSYYVELLALNKKGHRVSVNVSGNSTEVTMPSFELFGVQYDITIIATTNAGNSTTTITKTVAINQLIPDDEWGIFKIIMAVLAPVFVLVVIFLFAILICHRRAKFKRYEERCRYFEELEQKAPIDPNSNFDYKSKNINLSLTQLAMLQMEMDCSMLTNDGMEVPRTNVKILEILGEGAFGLVKKGMLKMDDGNEKEIAVKMFKDTPSADDFKEFRREIEVMKSVGEHQNIVCIVGHCTKNITEMMLLTEFCCNGNLLNYLRSEWKHISEIQTSILENICNTPALLKQKSPESVFNFDTSFVEKSFRYKNINDENQQTYNESNNHIDDCHEHNNIISDNNDINETNLIINKLYDEYNNSSSIITISEKINKNNICTNSCKCNVEILNVDTPSDYNFVNNVKEINYTELNNVNNDDEHNNDNIDDDYNSSNNKEINRKCKIKINDCECYKNCDKNNILINKNKNGEININNNQTLIVENPTYNELIKNEQNNLMNINCDSESINEINKSKRDKELMAGIDLLTCEDLLSFAKQISCGMDFLSKNKVVHRDLAARNVLVCANKIVKIADFGLSRDIYQENMYKKTGDGKLPIKWLALESMTHQVYTSQSDVWSYGILLYEIVTLGGNPYPSIPTNRLLKLLKTGFRMEKPKNCSSELYNLMFSCWNTNPHSRPTFNEICEKIGHFMDSERCDYINFELNDNPKRAKSTTDDAYLKPI